MSTPMPLFPTLVCRICFEAITPGTCATDGDGVKWDVCVTCYRIEMRA